MASTPTSSPLSQHTNMTTPPQADSPTQHSPTRDPNDTSDIWASDSPPHALPSNTNSTAQPPHQPQQELSDLPSLRRQHITSGYREGLSAGKAKVIQSGFDAGYPLGMSLALRVGKVLGVLEGLRATPSVKNDERRRKAVEQLLEQARRELDVKSLLAGVDEESVAGAQDVQGLASVEGTVRKWEGEVLRSWDKGEEQSNAD